MPETAEKTVAARLQWQADACQLIGSPLYAGMLERATNELERRGTSGPLRHPH